MILSLNFHNLMLAFLREPESRAVIVCSIRFEKPPLAGLTDLMNPRFPALTDGEKATTGKLVLAGSLVNTLNPMRRASCCGMSSVAAVSQSAAASFRRPGCAGESPNQSTGASTATVST